jgi:hypothetical protein
MSVIRLTPPGYHSLVPTAGAIIVVALVASLSAVELLRAYGSPSPAAALWRRRFALAAIPLLALTVLVVVARLAPIA